MIHAFHGNMGLPSHLGPLLDAVGHASNCLHLWEYCRTRPRAAESLEGFAATFAAEKESRAGAGDWLLGYSLGGRLALHTLLAAPHSWKGAVILSAHPGLTDVAARVERRAADQVWAESCREGDWAAFNNDWLAQPVLRGALPEGDPQPWRDQIATAFSAWSLGTQEDLRPRLAALRVPVLWVTGEHDERYTALAAEVCSGHPTMEHRVIPAAGHRLPADAPGQCAGVIREFLAKHRD